MWRSQPIYPGEALTPYLQFAGGYSPINCTPHFVSNVLHWVSFGRLCWLLHFGDALLLDKCGNSAGTICEELSCREPKSSWRGYLANGNTVFCRTLLHGTALTCACKGNMSKFVPLQNVPETWTCSGDFSEALSMQSTYLHSSINKVELEHGLISKIDML